MWRDEAKGEKLVKREGRVPRVPLTRVPFGPLGLIHCSQTLNIK